MKPGAGARSSGPGGGVWQQLGSASARLFCWVGHHAPDASMVWHQGYGFAHCQRCGQAIVRSLLSDWTVPGSGLRIVWPGAKGATPAAAAGRASGAAKSAARGVEPLSGSSRESFRRATGAGPAAAPTTANGESGTSARAGDDVLDPGDSAIPVIVRGKTAAGADLVRTPAEPAISSPKAATAAFPEPLDLLGPHFMGDNGAPPGPRDGMEVFVFDDMAASNDDGLGKVGEQRAG